MFDINDNIGKQFREKKVSAIKKDGGCVPLFSIIDILEEEMQDYVSSKEDDCEVYDEHVNIILQYQTKVAIFSEKVIEDFDTDVNPILVPLHLENNNDGIKKLLPQRQTVAYVRFSKNGITNEDKLLIENDEIITGCLKELVEKHFGYNYECFQKYLGKTILVCYNPIYKSIDLKEDGEKPGLYFRVNYWNGHREQLLVEIASKNKNGEELIRKTFKSTEGVFLSYFDLEKDFHKLDIEVKTLDGTIIDYYKDVTFIRSIEVKLTTKD